MLSNTILFIGLLALGTPAPSTADQALTVLQQNCGNENCHGGADAYRFDVGNLSTLVEAGVVKPGRAADSEVIRRIEAGIMPLGGYKGRPGVRLPPEDVRILREWIDAGAPVPSGRASTSRRPFVSESQILASILSDLQSSRAADRPYLRYFTLANLWNSSDVQANDIEAARAALAKLTNHLSWNREIARPTSLGPESLILRIDLREYAWTWETWRCIAESYPYGIATRELAAKIERIEDLSGATIPYIRADWFVANASRPPLYHEILQLPATLERLEDMLSVNAEFDVERNFARRFGVRDSGVSRNNRAMERHSTVFGGYWKSFDFAGNNPEQDIFRNPLDLHADGGEIIFSLPNGLQGYFIVNKQGGRIDDAPANIVRDRTNTDDPVVHNGRSCIGCHVKGMNAFQDQMVTTFDTRTEALFDLERARSLYSGQTALDALFESDNHRFADALARAGVSVPVGASDEPVNRVGRRYESTVTAAQAAADLSIEDPETLLAIIAGSAELQTQGFDQFLGPRGGMKRDAWEHGFAAIAGFRDGCLNHLNGSCHLGDLGNRPRISSKKPAASIVVSIEGAR